MNAWERLSLGLVLLFLLVVLAAGGLKSCPTATPTSAAPTDGMCRVVHHEDGSFTVYCGDKVNEFTIGDHIYTVCFEEPGETPAQQADGGTAEPPRTP